MHADALTTDALLALFEVVPGALWIIDDAGRIRRANRRAHEMHAELPDTVRALWERQRPAIPGSDAPLAFAEHPAMRALGGVLVQRELQELRALVEGGGHAPLVEVSAVPVRDVSGTITGAVLLQHPVLDDGRLEQLVSERSRGRLEVEEARARERRLAAVGQLAAGVMHDVNNALNPIMAAAYLLRHHAESPAAVRDYAERIRMAAETGAATASRVGRFIRQEPLHAGGDESIDLSALAAEIIDLTEPMRLKRSSGSREVRVARMLADGVRTRGVPGEIREALLNLVQNAMDAMPDGGTLTVRTYVARDEACIAIQDDGVGMSRETLDRAFEPFFTTKGAGGSGLGLAEVYGVARRHRGTATIESEAGAGTTVTLRLPVERVPGPGVTETTTSPGRTEPLRVLLVEDHDDGREFLRRLLETEGHVVETATTIAEARERLASAGAMPYHLLLTDVGLPDGSGWDLAAHAKEREPGLRIGVVTGWEPMVSSSEARGVEFVLRKPLRAAELMAHIAGRHVPAQTEPTND